MTDIIPGQTIRYRMYDFKTLTFLSELPLSGVSFGQRLNTAGSFTGSLSFSHPAIRKLAPISSTQPARTLLVVDFDGVIVWAGMLWTRQYQRSKRTLDLGGQEAWSYFTRRVQARDYSTQWNTTPADALIIAQTVIQDALNVANSGLSQMSIVRNYVITNPAANFITAAYPINQVQTVDQIVGTLAQMGYGVGFDFNISWAYSGNTPIPTLTLSYPRCGVEYSAAAAMLSVQPSQDYTWPEDGTLQANKLYATASQSSGTSVTVVDNPSSLAAGYPLLEQVNNYTQVNTGSELEALAAGGLATAQVPVVTPVVTVDPFGPFQIGSFALGDDVRMYVPPLAGVVGDISDERFPGGPTGQY